MMIIWMTTDLYTVLCSVINGTGGEDDHVSTMLYNKIRKWGITSLLHELRIALLNKYVFTLLRINIKKQVFLSDPLE